MWLKKQVHVVHASGEETCVNDVWETEYCKSNYE